MKIAFISALSVLAAVSPVAGAENPKVILDTTKGQITVELYPKKRRTRSRTSWPMWMQAFTTAPFFTGSSPIS